MSWIAPVSAESYQVSVGSTTLDTNETSVTLPYSAVPGTVIEAAVKACNLSGCSDPATGAATVP